MHHFPFHISDFALATQRFTPEQVGIFLALLMEYYKTEKPLPADVEELCFMSGAMTAGAKKAVEFVLRRCFVLNPEGTCYHQRRADRELENYRKACRQNLYAIVCKHWERVNRGYPKPTFEEFTAHTGRYYDADTRRLRALTGRKDLVLSSEEDGNTAPLPDDSQPRSNIHDPRSKNQCTPVVPTGTPTIEALAGAIYGLYPLKVGRTKALAAIVKVLKAGAITELDLQAKVRAYAEATSRWDKQDRTFIPHPSTWFNQGRYLDDPDTWIREPAEDAKKKKGGGAVGETSVPLLQIEESPAGWETAMWELWGPEWRASYAAWPTMPPADQRQVRCWLEKNGPGVFECPVPADWHALWETIFEGRECPGTWAEVCAAEREAITSRGGSKQ